MAEAPALPPIGLGVVGLGRAFTLMWPTFRMDARVRLYAACDPLEAARAQFVRDVPEARVGAELTAVLTDPRVEVVYVASPHQLHAEQVCAALDAGKHVLVEKPMALTETECLRMIERAAANGRQLIVGHSHAFNRPVAEARARIVAGEWGAVRMVHAFNYTDFLYRPRRPEELDTAAGGGVVFSQAAHQVAVVRTLVGQPVTAVQALTGQWDTTRPTEGAYSALLRFGDAAFASLTYSGYGHFDSDQLLGDIGEMGQPKRPEDYGAARRRLAQQAQQTQQSQQPADEAALKAARNYGGAHYAPPPLVALAYYQHFGHVLVSCEQADVRLLPDGLAVYADDRQHFLPLPPPTLPRQEVIDALWSAVRLGEPPLHDGHSGLETLRVCRALLQSAASGQTVPLCSPLS